MTRKEREALEMHLGSSVRAYKAVCRGIEDMHCRYPELKEWLSDQDLYNDPIIMEFNELDQRRVYHHDRCLEILKELGIEFKSKGESHEYLLVGWA